MIKSKLLSLVLLCGLLAAPQTTKPSASLAQAATFFATKPVLMGQVSTFPMILSLAYSTLIGFGQAGYLLLTHEDFSEHVLGAQKNVIHYSTTVSIAKNNKRRIISRIIHEQTFTSPTARQTAFLAAEWLQKMLPKDYIGIIQPSITLRDNNTCYLYAIRIKQENSASSQDILFETFAAAEQLYKAAPKPVFFWAKPFAVMRAGLWLTIELLFPSQEKRTIN